MNLHKLKPAKGSTKKPKRVGRGGTRGTTAGKGTKGQKARSGYSRSFGFEGGRTPLSKQLPKLKGFKSGSKKPTSVTLQQLSGVFKDGDTVSQKTLYRNGLTSAKGQTFKIIGSAEISIKLNVEGGSVSKTAKTIIEKAGGSIKEIARPEPKNKNKKKDNQKKEK